MKPSDFMKLRRPEQFSDSVEFSEASLERGFFEYQLDTLTSRGEEKCFEHFCRKLAQKELCPNLIPQTGPTGGGDSKVDTETYPVAIEIADRWYEGMVNAASERWGFAISAKKDWKSKVQSDVAKIAGTGRDYKVVYFMSNQFVKDKDRAEMEDSLGGKYGFQVRILDRSWIVDRVYDRNHIALAIDALNINISVPTCLTKVGSLDATKHEQLNELERQIADQDFYYGVPYQLAEDCLSAAVLSRELQLSRTETDGRFDRAERIANKLGSPGQIAKTLYQKAWTNIFWFDDFNEASCLYPRIEELTLPSSIPAQLERLSNLCSAFTTGVSLKLLTSENAQIEARMDRLCMRLRELAGDQLRPNNSAQAQALLCTATLVSKIGDSEAVEAALRSFGEIFQQSKHLVGFPFDKYANIFEEFGDFLGRLPAYDEVFERLVPLLEARRSESAAGHALMKRGIQKLEAGLAYDAIRLLGRAQPRLSKHEHRHALTICHAVCANAYKEVGLLWAANASTLIGAATALQDFNDGGRIGRAAAKCVEQMVWLEIRHGRIPQLLANIELLCSLNAYNQTQNDEADAIAERMRNLDGVLGMLLLRCPIDQLSHLERLPPTLEKMGLVTASMALLVALGQTDAVLSERLCSPGTTREEVEDLFRELADQPAKDDLPYLPTIFHEPTVTLLSSLLGCEWRITVDNNQIAMWIGEAFLAFAEALFATSLLHDAIPHRQYVNIVVTVGSATNASSPKSILLVPGIDDLLFTIQYGSDYNFADEAVTGRLRNFLEASIPHLISGILHASDVGAYLNRIAGEEEAFGRCLIYSNLPTCAGNIFGGVGNLDIRRWLTAEQKHPSIRVTPFINSGSSEKVAAPNSPRYGTGDPPSELMKPERLKHEQRRVLSPIREDLWASAGWQGVGTLIYPNGPPILALFFKDQNAAEKIFLNWENVYGSKVGQVVRVAIIRGISTSNPSSYRLIVGIDPDFVLEVPRQKFAEFATVSRMKTMDQADPQNLERFLTAYNRFGCYGFAPAFSKPGGHFELSRRKTMLRRKLVIRSAWEIGEHDPDLIGLLPEDDIFVPTGVTDPPFKRALARMQMQMQ